MSNISRQRAKQIQICIARKRRQLGALKACHPTWTATLQWRRAVKENPSVLAIIQYMRDTLYYNPATDDYAIWMVVLNNYNKLLKKEKNGKPK